MKIASYNIQFGKGSDGVFDLPRIANELHGADIAALQEVDRFWPRSGMEDQAQRLADLMEEYYWIFGPGLDMDASYRDSAEMLINRRRQHGNLILSRYPIISSRNFPLPKTAALDNHSIQQALLETVIATPLGDLRIYNTHLFYWSPRHRYSQIPYLLEKIKKAPDEGGAWCGIPGDEHWTAGESEPPMPRELILLGDLNCGCDSPEYELLVGPLDEEGNRFTSRDKLIDAWVAGGNDEGAISSCHKTPTRIDHCLISPTLRNRVTRAWRDDDATGSDHYPLWFEFK